MRVAALLLVSTLLLSCAAFAVQVDSTGVRAESLREELTFAISKGMSYCALDCNADTIPDDYDIAIGASTDENHDFVPDECDLPDLGFARWHVSRERLGLCATCDSASHKVHVTYEVELPGRRYELKIVEGSGRIARRLTGRASGRWRVIAWKRPPPDPGRRRAPFFAVLRCDTLVLARWIPYCPEQARN